MLEARSENEGRHERLALFGGRPIRNRQWPKWPRADAATQRSLLDVLHSTKWTLSGQSDRLLSYERRFAEAFATYCGGKYGVSCGSGTAALTIALQALGVGPGDEVLVPGLTWVACASAVCNVGATPVLIDVEPATLCISAQTIQPALSPHTRAILLVHLYSSLAPISEICTLANEMAIPVIEDASQAHGARIAGGRAGTFGAIGVFSMQQSKLLASGEGGVCVTNDPALYRRLQQLRADGRLYADEVGGTLAEEPAFQRQIVPCGEVFGRNYCMSEFHAAILLERLPLLDAENTHRRRNFDRLHNRLTGSSGLHLVTGAAAEESTHYRVCVRLEESLLRGFDIKMIARAIAAELRLPVEPVDAPLNNNPLYAPLLSPMLSRFADAAQYDPRRFRLPEAEAAARCCLTLPHWALLGDDSDLDDIVAAFRKVLVQYRGSLVPIR